MTFRSSSESRIAFVLFIFLAGATVAADRQAAPVFEFSRGADGESVAENTAHRLSMTLERDEGRLRFSLLPRVAGDSEKRLSFRLEGWGRSDIGTEGLESPPFPSTAGQRLELDHGAVVEWFENGPRGTEHGFTLRSSPASREEGPLRVVVRIETDLLPGLSQDGRQIVFRTPQGEIALYYHGLVVTDATERTLDARMEFVETRLHFVVDDTDAIYPVVIDPLLTTIGWELRGDEQDLLGQRVGTFGDIDGDGASDIYAFDDDQIRW